MRAIFKSLSQLFNSPFELLVIGDSHFKVYGLEFRELCQCLSQLPCVVEPRKAQHAWSGEGIYAEFVWGGHAFQIEGDSWDEGLWIVPTDGVEHAEELRAIREHVKQGGDRA